MNGLYTIGLLVVSNIFMTFAWYGHIKLQQMKVITDATPLYVIILLSWLLAAVEGHPGSHIALGFHSLYGRVFQW